MMVHDACFACVDLGWVGTDHAAWVHGAGRHTNEGVTHVHLHERIRTLNAVQAERDELLAGIEDPHP